MLHVVLVSVLDVGDRPRPGRRLRRPGRLGPAHAGEGYVYVVLAPERIQAWREADEIAGRTLMRGGRWLV